MALPLAAEPSPNPGPAPFAGERIDFEVEWTGLLVGEIAVFDHGWTTLRDRPCHKIEAYARTKGAVEKLYRARRKYLGYLSPDHRSWLYEEWEKPKDDWRLQEWLGFFPEEGVVRRYKRDKLRNELAVAEGTFDPVGAVYWLRSRPLTPGERIETNVTQGKYNYRAVADIAPGPRLETKIGPVETVEITPTIYWKGEPLGKRTLKVWMTRDDRRIPVKLFADVEFGSFSADLSRYDPPAGEQGPGS